VIPENRSTAGVTTRWKAAMQQKGVLEYNCGDGMCSPTAEDIERITAVLKTMEEPKVRRVLGFKI